MVQLLVDFCESKFTLTSSNPFYGE
uniref:Uncharacterized protein n=1 Tax=Arundo donax TaxID=35708 RepID=A0A0A9C5X5_ARUDO